MYYNNRKDVSKLISMYCLTGILAVAAYEDLSDYRIRNELIITGWCIGLMYRLYYEGVTGIINWMVCVVSSVVLLFIFYLLRMFGAGDVKLLSVISGFIGTKNMLKVFVAALFIGSILSVIRCIRYGYLMSRLRYFAEYISLMISCRKIIPYYVKSRDGESVIIPFSVAIGIGFYVVMSGYFII